MKGGGRVLQYYILQTYMHISSKRVSLSLARSPSSAPSFTERSLNGLVSSVVERDDRKKNQGIKDSVDLSVSGGHTKDHWKRPERRIWTSW